MANAMEKENMAFPLHLGVTEAGDGEDGRIKSAVGIGTLLAEGIGDTIRVSLSEDPELEIPVAQKLAGYIAARSNHAPIHGHFCHGYDPLAPAPRATRPVGKIGGTNPQTSWKPTLPNRQMKLSPACGRTASCCYHRAIKTPPANCKHASTL